MPKKLLLIFYFHVEEVVYSILVFFENGSTRELITAVLSTNQPLAFSRECLEGFLTEREGSAWPLQVWG